MILIKNQKLFYGIVILIIIAFIVESCSTAQNKSTTTTKTDEKYFCESDTNCIGYGTCSINCVNKNWAENNSDNGPYCELLLPKFECKCLEKKCVAVKSTVNATPPVSSCTSDAECGEGLSCWYAAPVGPARGIPGSKENPGRCWSNKLIERIV